MKPRLKVLAVMLPSLLSSAFLFAQDGRGIQAGSSRIIPTLGLSFGYDDNVTSDSTDEIDSFVTIVSPGIQLENGDQERGVRFTYEGDFARFNDSSTDNYNNHRLALNGQAEISGRARINGGIGYERGTERRGTGARQGQFIELGNRDPDEYRRTNGDVRFDYGAEGSRAGFGLEAGTADTQYRNNRDYTQFRDYSDFYFGGMFRYRIASKTSATISVRQTDVDFDRERQLTTGNVNFDSTERELLLGLLFDATAKTSGRIEAGRIEKDFDSSLLDDFSGFGWRVGVQFRPRTYSSIDISTSRRTDEADDVLNRSVIGNLNSFILRRDITAAWTHNWTDRFQTGVDVVFGTDEYRSALDEGRGNRDDDFTGFGVSADYTFRPWLSVGASYRHYDRDSNIAIFDYDRNFFLLSFEGTL